MERRGTATLVVHESMWGERFIVLGRTTLGEGRDGKEETGGDGLFEECLELSAFPVVLSLSSSSCQFLQTWMGK